MAHLLGLKTRLYSGFGVLVVLGLALAGFAVWQLSATRTQVAQLSGFGENVARALEAAAAIQSLTRSNLRFTVDADEASATGAAAAETSATELLTAAAAATQSEERRVLYNAIKSDIAALRTKRESLMTLGRQIKAARETLFTGGDALTAATSKLVEARAGVDPAAAALLSPIESSVLLVRVANWRFLATRDPKGPATFKTNAERAGAAIAALEGASLPDGVRVLIGTVKATLAAYVSNFEAVAPAMVKIDELFWGDMVPQTRGMLDKLEKVQASLKQAAAGVKSETFATIDTTILTQQVIAGLALALGVVIAFLVGRSIVGPVAGMTAAMERLAAGDNAVEIPSRDNTDELGAMAKAVEVFKRNAIERTRLEAEQKDAEARLAAERRAAEERQAEEKQAAAARQEAARKAGLNKLATDFEAAIGGIVENVSAASSQLETSARTLTKTADTTQRLSNVVASASEEASANVQSVASATEEMSSSINEISRQVQESSTIAGEAVRQAEATDARINELSKAAARIGDVVKLITSVAEQTNLLALNATIEAARAGEAGKGFAVVAQEVKALAAQTAKATDEISSQIVGMQDATAQSVTAIKEIGSTIGRISNIASTIAAAVEEQGAATQEISRNVGQAARGTAQVAANITDVNRGAGETGSASAQVLSSAQSLSSESSRLKAEVGRFLATIRVA